MRKNCRQAVDAFVAGKPLHPAKSIWTDGAVLWSYQTPIAVKRDNTVVLNVTRYSVTTSIHQSAVIAFFRQRCAVPPIEVPYVAIGSSPERLYSFGKE